MSIYEGARRHAWFMAGALVLAILFVLTVEQFAGHSTIAFGIAIVGLMLANARNGEEVRCIQNGGCRIETIGKHLIQAEAGSLEELRFTLGLDEDMRWMTSDLGIAGNTFN